jgi:hypothetical protein
MEIERGALATNGKELAKNRSTGLISKRSFASRQPFAGTASPSSEYFGNNLM